MRRNPNHYGSVVKLSGNRRRPFMVRSGVYGYTDQGYPIFDIIGYTATREEGNILLAEFNRNPWDVDKAKITLKELFDLWKEKKAPKLGESNRASLCSAFNHCSKLVNRPYKSIKAYEMQETIDECGRGYSTQGAIKNLWGHLDRFALELDEYPAVILNFLHPPQFRLQAGNGSAIRKLIQCGTTKLILGLIPS